MKLPTLSKQGRGRPSKYSLKMVTLTKKYVQSCLDRDEIPFVEELALNLGVNDSTLWHWANKYEEFQEAYEILLTVQRLLLKKKGLSGQYRGSIVSLMLSAEHHLVSKQRNEVKIAPNEVKNGFLTPDQEKYVSKEITRVFEHVYSQPKNNLLG
jgi:hypothetical protein